MMAPIFWMGTTSIICNRQNGMIRQKHCQRRRRRSLIPAATIARRGWKHDYDENEEDANNVCLLSRKMFIGGLNWETTDRKFF